MDDIAAKTLLGGEANDVCIVKQSTTWLLLAIGGNVWIDKTELG